MKHSGFTLIELLAYTFILVLVLSAVGSFVLWTVRAHTKAEIMSTTRNQMQRALDRMALEIREADSVYDPTSVFGTHPGQLSLATAKYAPSGAPSSYIDFFVCTERLCLKKEGQEPVSLTSEGVKITSLVFSKVGEHSVRIEITGERDTASSRPEFQADITLQTSSSIRAHDASY